MLAGEPGRDMATGMTGLPSFDSISENFSFLEDWEDRYRYLIELGQMLPAFPESDRNADNKVSGCVSQVWLTVDQEPGPPPVLVFHGDSDAMIVKGLVAVLLALYSGRPAAEIAQTDAVAVLDKMGLREHLTSQRSNGLSAMVQRMRAQASEWAAV